jgi:two-component system sensor histidine kinase KdpD
MSRELASTRGVDALLRIAVRHVGEVFGGEVAVSLPDVTGRLGRRAGSLGSSDADPNEHAVAQWVHDHGQMAGLGSATLPGARALYVPLLGSRGTIGVLGIRPARPQTLAAPEQLHLLETFAAQTALAVERGLLGEEAARTQLQIESERLRNSLLSSVSHDLRTPLATITGAASGLLEGADRLDPAARRELLQAIHEEADRLNRLVNNLLDMTRLESGAVQVRKEWHSLEELVGSALARLAGRLREHPVTTRLPPDLPLVPLDGVLMEQVLINLLDNAVKHTPPGTPIEVSAFAGPGEARIEVADRGPGLLPGDELRVFDKFYRGAPARPGPGVGLGLTICRGIVEAHGGRITAQSRPNGGVAFRVALPLADKPPEIPADDG